MNLPIALFALAFLVLLALWPALSMAWGHLIELFGLMLQNYGESLSAGYCCFVDHWRYIRQRPWESHAAIARRKA